jgi:hypothetical protein
MIESRKELKSTIQYEIGGLTYTPALPIPLNATHTVAKKKLPIAPNKVKTATTVTPRGAFFTGPSDQISTHAR